MISIIICSRDEKLLQKVTANISETIGVEFETIIINNKKRNYSIFQAYNFGIAKSKYDMLCFMHEDIQLETLDWGKKVLEIFLQNPRLGLLGVAGSNYKSLVPSGWSFHAALEHTVKINIVQCYKTGKNPESIVINTDNEQLSKVATVDGLWFCAPKFIAQKYGFDEHTFKNFHCYDIDFSLSILQQHEVAVTFEVLITHFSEGNPDESWLSDTVRLHQKWKDKLPVNLKKISLKEQKEQESRAFDAILNRLVGRPKIILKFLNIITSFKLMQIVGLKRFIGLQIAVIKRAI